MTAAIHVIGVVRRFPPITAPRPQASKNQTTLSMGGLYRALSVATEQSRCDFRQPALRATWVVFGRNVGCVIPTDRHPERRGRPHERRQKTLLTEEPYRD